MKRLIVVLTLILTLGVTQQALADPPKGVWGCGGGILVTSTNVFETWFNIRNWSDKGTLTIQDISVYDSSGVPQTVTFSPIQLGPHERAAVWLKDLLSIPWPPTPTIRLSGSQTIIKWKATWAARPSASGHIRRYWRDSDTGALTLFSSTAHTCRDLR